MLKVIKLAFYLFFLLALAETFWFFHKKSPEIRSSVQEIGSGFMDTAQQILNEGNSNLTKPFSEINDGAKGFIRNLAD